MVLNHALLIGLILGTGVDVHIRPLTGPTFQARWVGVEDDVVLIQQDGQPERLAWSRLWEITPVAPAEATGSLMTVWIELIDGSKLLADRYQVSAGVAQLRLIGGPELEIRTRSIRSVRFRDHSASPELANQWQGIVSGRHAGDVVVIRRQESLDFLEGALSNVSDDVVRFDFDGETIEANRQRLDGLIYYHPLARQLPPRVCQLIDVSGSRWMAQSFTLDGDTVRWTTPTGVSVAFPMERIKKLDFSAGNTVWLSDLEPESVQRRSFVASQLPQESLDRLFGPRRDQSFSGGPMMLDGVTYSRGLALTSRTEITFRLAEDFRRFHAMVGIDDAVRDAGHVELVISGDGRELFNRTVTGRDQAFPIELEISGIRRLKILVDFGEQMDIADHLNLSDARLTK